MNREKPPRGRWCEAPEGVREGYKKPIPAETVLGNQHLKQAAAYHMCCFSRGKFTIYLLDRRIPRDYDSHIRDILIYRLTIFPTYNEVNV